MKKLMLEDYGRLYTETQRRPDARLFTAGELVRFSSGENGLPRGTVLRVDGIDGPNQILHLRRRSGEVVRWSPREQMQVFSPSEGEVKRGMVFEWSRGHSQSGAEQGDLGRVVDIHPTRGVTVRSNKLGDVRFSLEPGTWHHAITEQGVVGHLRDSGDHRLESYRDVGPTPEGPTHDEPFHRLGQPYSMLTHGAPPSLEVLARGDLVYFASAKATDIPDNHVFVVSEIDRERGRVRLVEGRELSAEPQRTRDVWWRPAVGDEVRTYKPGKSVAAQDLVMWKKDDANLLVRRGDFAEVLEIRPTAMVVTGVTSTPEVLKIDRDRWSPQWHRENGTWHLARAGCERSFERERGAPLMVHSM